MSTILEEIRQMLLQAVDSEKIIRETATHFYESVEEKRKKQPELALKLEQYATLKEYLEAAAESKSLELQEILEDLQEDIAYTLEDMFDRAEDDVKHALLKGKMAARVRQDIKEKGIVFAEKNGRREQLTEDDVEEIYVEAFEELDALHLRLWQYILSIAPSAYYEQGRKELEAYRQANGLLMDAKEFNEYYEENFDKERLWALFAQKIYESIHYNRRYILEEPTEEEEEGIYEDESEEESYEASQKDAVLIGAGDLQAEEFGFVYELMEEYTGRRVLPSENEWNEEAYWLTYGDDFAELLGLFMIAQLENTIRYFAKERPQEYDTFAKLYHWNQEQREDPEVVLSSCDKISYYLSDFQEALWNEFMESKLQPFYDQGKAMVKEK
ncbi:MAG: hypothetical protein HFE64_06470 [Lachnospiraceae bacterium]|jgi:hypothetical protein|nr:hypothetical protein [Lachnospiraceae bacterium]